jgi:hypothetical protein
MVVSLSHVVFKHATSILVPSLLAQPSCFCLVLVFSLQFLGCRCSQRTTCASSATTTSNPRLTTGAALHAPGAVAELMARPLMAGALRPIAKTRVGAAAAAVVVLGAAAVVVVVMSMVMSMAKAAMAKAAARAGVRKKEP